MRIVFLADRIPPYERGGGGKIPWRLAQGLQARGHEIAIISATAENTYSETRDSIPISYLHSAYNPRWRAWRSLYNPQTIPLLKNILADFKPDVVNLHNVHSDLSYASGLSDLYPSVFSAHDLMPIAYAKVDYFIQTGSYKLPWGHNLRQMRGRYNPFRNLAIRWMLNKMAGRVAISRAHKAALEANGLAPFRVVYHGFDAAEYPRPAEDVIESLRQDLGLVGQKIIFFGGRLSVEKGSRELLKAADLALKDLPNLKILLLSSAPFERQLLMGLSRLTEAHICETGWLEGEKLLAAYHLADVVAVPSVYLDPVPTTVFEAMAVAKPALVTCFGGSPEVVIDGETAFVVNPFDTNQFAARMLDILSDDALAEKMGQAAQAHLAANFSFAQQLDGMLAAYQDALIHRRKV